MNRGSVYKRSDSSNLWLWYYDHTGKRIHCSAGTPDIAAAWQILRRLQKAPSDSHRQPRRNATPLRQQLIGTLRSQLHSARKADSTAHSDIGRLEIFADYCLANRDIRFTHEITTDILTDFGQWLKQTRSVSNATVNRYFNTICGVLPERVHANRLPVGDGIGKEIPDPVFREILQAASIMDPHLPPFLILLAETGLRTGHLCRAELAWLKTYRYDSSSVGARSHLAPHSTGYVPANSRSQEFLPYGVSRRYLNFPSGASNHSKKAPLVPLNETACTIIDSLHPSVIPAKATGGPDVRPGLKRFLFDSGSGTPRYTPYRIHRRWRRIVLRLGYPEYRPYDIRHTWAIREIMRTGDIAYVSRVLGHAKATTTLLYYQNLSMSRLIERNTGSNITGLTLNDLLRFVTNP